MNRYSFGIWVGGLVSGFGVIGLIFSAIDGDTGLLIYSGLLLVGGVVLLALGDYLISREAGGGDA